MPESGDILGDFALIAPLGSGGYGTVWRARQLSTDRVVAFKLMNGSADSEASRRFVREGALVRRLQHPGCVQYVDAGRVDPGHLFLATELVPGVQLDQWGKSNPSFELIADVGMQIASCLAYTHREGVVHRDLKPANVLVVAGPRPTVKILDFGIAKMLGIRRSDITKTGIVIGTAGYMSPEQLRGASDIGAATDQYSLGVILYELLAGRAPFGGSTAMELGIAHLSQTAPPLPPHTPPHLVHVVERLLSKDPSGRFPTMTHVERALADEAPPVHDGRSGRRQDAPHRSSWVLPAAASALLVGVGATWMVSDDDPAVVARPKPPRHVKASASPETDAHDVGKTAASRGPGCTPRSEDGEVEIVYESRTIASYVPPIFRPERNPPLIVLLRGGGMSESEFIGYTGFSRIANEIGAAVVAPTANSSAKAGSAQWDDIAIAQAWEQIQAAKTQLCTPNAEIVILGEGAGGQAADRMVCEHADEIAAVATTGSRYPQTKQGAEAGTLDGQHPCTPSNVVPTLMLFHRQDPIHPWSGGPSCRDTNHVVKSAQAQEQRWVGLHECADASTSTQKQGGVCHEWQNCKQPLVSCHVNGGRQWAQQPQRSEAPKCAGVQSEFDHTNVVWDFFQRHLPILGPLGCSLNPEPGAHSFDPAQGGEQFFVYVPEGYEAGVPHSTIVYFHRDLQGAPKGFRQSGLARLADAHKLLVLAPRGGQYMAWALRPTMEQVHSDLHEAHRHVCIDETRIYAIGHGPGGRAATWLGCEMESLAGVGTFAFSRQLGRDLCESYRPTPYINLAPTQSPWLPLGGRTDRVDFMNRCPSQPKKSFDEHEKWLRSNNKCRGAKQPYGPHPNECSTWTCAEPFVSCKIPGGSAWPADTENSCDGPLTTFDVGEAMWQFFDNLDR